MTQNFLGLVTWSGRFWEQVTLAEGDYERQGNYLNYNLVKQGQVTWVGDWPYSSWQRYVERGIYNLAGAADDNVRGLETEYC
jgi:putative transposase